MNVDAELEVWREQWQSAITVPVDLRKNVERQSRFMRVVLIGQIFVTITIGGVAADLAFRSPRSELVFLAVATWLFIATAWIFAFMVNRGNWSPSALDTATFVELSVRRCRARLTAIRFAAGLVLSQLAFCLGWVYKYSAEHRRPLLAWLFFGSAPIDIVWLCTLAFFGFLVWFRRRKRAELAYLLSLRERMPARAD